MSKIDWSSMYKKEDWWALWLGLLIFFLGLGPLARIDTLGWGYKVINIWADPAKALAPFSNNYAWLPGIASLFLTYLFMLILTSIGVVAMKYNLKKFVTGFTIIFWLTAVIWVLGNNVYSAATPDTWKTWKISWGLSLTPEGCFIYLLLVGLLIRNVFKSFAEKLLEAARPEWYIKTAIVILGAAIGVKAVGATGMATTILFLGLCAVIVAYLIYWPLVYFISRKYFKLTKEWAAPLASGISVCGVAAAIATGAAIKSRSHIPITLSSIVVAFAVVELIILPWMSWALYPTLSPMVMGAWMGLTVKTDGAAVASGALVDALIIGKAAGMGIHYEEGWMLMAATTTKIFIDVFIGVWAFVLAVIWATVIEKREGTKVSKLEIWFRFPKFVIGYFVTFLLLFTAGMAAGAYVKGSAAANAFNLAAGEMDLFRVLFFALTFLSIGLITDLRVFRKEGLGKVVLVYFICLFGFILWIGLFISWIFFHNVYPPLKG